MKAPPIPPVDLAASSSCLAPDRLDAVLLARNDTARQHRRRTAVELRAWADTLLACELARCQSRMTPGQWAEHRDWIEANARESLRAALVERAERGRL